MRKTTLIVALTVAFAATASISRGASTESADVVQRSLDAYSNRPPPDLSGARPIQSLDYETGDFDQWGLVNAEPGGATIVTSPVRQGKYAAKFVVGSGDDPINSTGERADLNAGTGEKEGTESWWAWSTLFPSEFDPNPDSAWNVFTNWHHTGSSCPSPVSFLVDTQKDPVLLRVRVWGGPLDEATCDSPHRHHLDLAPLERNKWHDFMLHVKWSSNPDVGFVEIWLNGELVAPKFRTATLYSGYDVYVKQGYGRGESSRTTVIYHDGLRRYDTALVDRIQDIRTVRLEHLRP